jgi:hypothetical protein
VTCVCCVFAWECICLYVRVCVCVCVCVCMGIFFCCVQQHLPAKVARGQAVAGRREAQVQAVVSQVHILHSLNVLMLMSPRPYFLLCHLLYLGASSFLFRRFEIERILGEWPTWPLWFVQRELSLLSGNLKCTAMPHSLTICKTNAVSLYSHFYKGSSYINIIMAKCWTCLL